MQAKTEQASLTDISWRARTLQSHLHCSGTRRLGRAPLQLCASVTDASTANATATTTKRMPELTVGKCPRVKPTEYNYTKQMKPGVTPDQPAKLPACDVTSLSLKVLACGIPVGPYKMTMGLEPMNPVDWMEIDSLYEEEMELRQEILKNKRHLVIACQPCVSCLLYHILHTLHAQLTECHSQVQHACGLICCQNLYLHHRPQL